jgi:hypothetical protein
LALSQRNPTGDCSCFYYFFMAIVVIRYETKTAARRALTFIVRIFVNDTIAITVWTSFYFHACSCSPLWTGRAIQGVLEPDCLFIDIGCLHAGYRAERLMVDVRYWHLADLRLADGDVRLQVQSGQCLAFRRCVKS